MNLSPIRILQIDDDCDDAEIVQEALRGCHDADYRVTHVPSLSRASDALRCASFDVILLDLGLPESTGTQTLMRFMEGFDQTAPVIVLTGASNDDAALELLDLGAQDYLVKSEITAGALSRAIRYSVQRQQNFEKIRDLLDEVQASRSLMEKKNQRLAKLYDQAHEFVDNVSHEFRTPLTVIKEYVSLIREGLVGEVNVEQERLLNVVEDRADDLNTMVDDMLDVSKLEAGMLGAWRRDCQVEEVINHVWTSLERKAAVKNVTLEWSVDSNLPTLYCDAEKASRVITNLAINAIKFCGEPGHVRIAAEADPATRDVVISITDNGPGIDDDVLESIFQRFKQLSLDPRGSTKGFGLGLSIAKALVALNFGQMSVRSKAGEGSTFSFTLPMAEPLEVVRRYLHQLAQFDEAEGGVKALSIVSATIEEVDDESLADDVDAFLNCCLRKSDLLFRCAPSRWVIVLPDSSSPVADRVDWIEQQRHAANRNRPGGLLPPLDLLVHGTWNTANEQQAIVDGIRQATESVLDELAPAGA